MDKETEKWKLKSDGLVRQMESMDTAFRERVKEIVDALRFYADKSNYVEIYNHRVIIMEDRGKKAIEALNGSGK